MSITLKVRFIGEAPIGGGYRGLSDPPHLRPLHYALFHSHFDFVSCVLDFFSRFESRFLYRHVGIKSVCKSARKTREKHKKITILHYALGKNMNWLRFFHAFWNV